MEIHWENHRDVHRQVQNYQLDNRNFKIFFKSRTNYFFLLALTCFKPIITFTEACLFAQVSVINLILWINSIINVVFEETALE